MVSFSRLFTSTGQTKARPARLTAWPLAAFAAALLAHSSTAQAQAPVALPNTITTVAGGASGAGGTVTGGVLPAKGAACSAGSPYTATDAYGDGCPGLNTAFSSDFRGGLQVDGQGNVFIMDTTNALLRRLDARSNVVTAVTGTAVTGCTTSSDSYGDGCPLAQTKLGTARGVWVDPYGNALIAGYGMQTINIVCNAVSPLCPNTTNRKHIGSMYRIAGCVASATATGTTGTGITNGTSGDGYAASPYGNLSGDVADWNPAGAANLGVTTYGSCTAAATLGAVSSPRGVAADRYGNVYIAETGTSGAGYRYRVVVGPATFTLPNGTVLNNPLAAIIALDPAYAGLTAASAYGKIYPILGGFTAAATGVTPPTGVAAACAGASGGVTLDTSGDGCPFYESTSGTGQQGMGVDAAGNAIFSDNSRSLVRVLFTEPSVAAGAPTTSRMAAAIRAANANPALAITQGYVYPIAGAVNAAVSSPAVAASPSLGTATTLSTGLTKVALDPSGNVYLSDFSNSSVLFFDIATGYVRRLLITGTACANKQDSLGDGCPVNTSSFGSGASGMGIGITPEGDLYLGDNTNLLLRKITASNLIPVAKGTTVTQTEIFHTAPLTTGITPSLTNPSAEITLGTAACAAANADLTVDCTVPVTFTPTAPGQRADSLAITTTGSATNALFPVAGIATAAALASDSTAPTTAPVGTVVNATALAVDGQDNIFLTDTGTQTFKEVSSTGSTTTLGGTLPVNPYQITLDPESNLFATSAGASTITRLTPGATGAYTSSTFTFVPTQATSNAAATTPALYGIVADHQGNLYVADRTNESVYEIPASNLQATTASSSNLNPVVSVKTGLTQAGELAFDGSGNLFIADTGANVVYRLLAGAAATTTFAANVNPTHIAADAAGNLYIEDATAKTVTEYTTSGLASVAVYTSTATPTGLAVASTGAAFLSNTGGTSLNQVQRNQAIRAFGATNGSANALAGELTNVGNSPAAGSALTAATGSKFIFDMTGTSTCGVIPSTANTLLAGESCSYSVYFNPATSGTTVAAGLTLLPVSSTGSLTLTGIEPTGTTFATTTTVTGPATAPYLPSGAEATYNVQVTAAGTTDVPTGTVTATSDCATGSGSYTLVAGKVSVSVSGCTAATHTLSVAYPNTGDSMTPNAAFGNSTGSATTVITQATTSVTWNPAVTTRQFSAALGLGVLDATAATSNGTTVPGTFVYSATNASGTLAYTHSASYLPIGTYSLNATFYPADATDFSSSTQTIPVFTVTKASTTASVGATQALVAADGTGNFTSVQSAVNALPASGGAVYIKPGTYTGDVTVVQPNVSLRGLGGDPRAVVLTHSGGAFGSTGVYAYAGEFTSAQNNGSQLPGGSSVFSGDEGSSTLVVAPGINTAVGTTSLTPNGFYGENLTLLNTYDSDTTTTTTTYVSGGVCSANAGPAQTYNALFNNSLLCASQALAIWNTADLSVFNNVYTTSLQDTIYAGSQGAGANGYVPSRQYWFRGKVTGTVDYIFGDAAAVFDYYSIYTVPKGSITGTETIEAQNKARQTGATGDYLSGYVMNSNVFTSYTTGMTGLDFGRPYGAYSTWLMLNSYIDQVAPAGYIEFSGDSNLPTSTYDEYNDLLYTDPAPNAADLNGVLYTGLGGNTGTGVTGTRETTSQSPGTAMAANAIRTSMTQIQAQPYFPTNFLSTTVPSTLSTTANWIPTDAIAADVNAFVPAGSTAPVAPGSSVTILMRPQTPGLGAITNGTYTVPTGTYTLIDTFNNAASILASGVLDASGEAFYTTATLAPGTHVLSYTYSGDANFSGSTTAAAYNLIVSGYPTVTTISASPSSVTYGQSSTVTAQVSSTTAGTLTGTVTLTIDSATMQTANLTAGTATFTVTGLLPGTHTLVATYAGVTPYAPSTSTTLNFVVTQSTPTLTVNPASAAAGGSANLSANVAYAGAQAPTGALTFTVNGSSTGIGTATCFGSTSPLTCTAAYTTALAPGSYTVTATEAADTNYTTASATGTLTIAQLATSIAVAPVTVPYTTAFETLTFTVGYTGSTAPAGAITITVNGSSAGVGAVQCATSASPIACSARYTAPALVGGTYALKVTQAADTNYAANSASSSLTITPIAPTISVAAVSAPFGTAATPLNATVAYSGAAAPTGAVTFLVNASATGVGTVTCTGAASPLTCKATYTPGSLAAGTYTVTATEAADASYTAASDTSSFLITTAPDFTFTNSGATYQTVLPGASANFNFTLAPLASAFPGAVTFSVTGLPAGATYTLIPTTTAVNAGAQSVVLTIVTPRAVSANTVPSLPWKPLSGLAFTALLLPLCLRRRAKYRLLLLLLALSTGLGVITGCATGNGYLTQPAANYTVVVTASSGSVQHSASVTLNLQ